MEGLVHMGLTSKRKLLGGAAAVALGGVAAIAIGASPSAAGPVGAQASGGKVKVEVFAPHEGDNAGIGGAGWFVDLKLDFTGDLASTGFTGPQLTGPLKHNSTLPFPGTFSTGHDDRNPRLVVLTSTTNDTAAGFHGPGTNLANLFNVTGVTDRGKDQTQLWDTWIVGAAIAGKDVDTTLLVAVVSGPVAPDVVPDANGDGVIDKTDIEALGVASDVVEVPFHINGAPLG